MHGSYGGSFFRKFILFFIAKKIFNKRVIYHIHASSYHVFIDKSHRIIIFFISFMIRNVDSLVVLSKWWKEYFVNQFNVSNVTIINNIVPLPDFSKSTKNKIPHFLFLGRIDDRKGIFDVVNAVSKNKELFHKKIKIIVGGDGRTEEFKHLIKVNDLEEIIQFVGWVSGDKKKKLLNQSDIMLLTSYNEGLPISLLEALSYKMPLISTHVGGISEILEHKKNGYVVDPGNIKQINDELMFYVANNDLIYKHGEKSYEIVWNYLPESVFNQLKVLYEKI